jgi:hypothetical protein
MPKVITFAKGSKRRLSQIRWGLLEVFSLVLLTVLVFALSLFVLMWELRHEYLPGEPTKGHQIRDATRP